MSDQQGLVDVIDEFVKSDADHLWLVADDVYFDLDERRFFGALESCRADLLSHADRRDISGGLVGSDTRRRPVRARAQPQPR